METSYFTDLTKTPTDDELKIALGELFFFWMEIRDFVIEKYPPAIAEWHVSVKKYGWGFRIKDKKRAIVYLSPKNGWFIVTFVFGQKATDEILASEVSQDIKTELINSKVYMEGRVVKIDVREPGLISDIKKLVLAKLAN
jgi:hypothetical protein